MMADAWRGWRPARWDLGDGPLDSDQAQELVFFSALAAALTYVVALKLSSWTSPFISRHYRLLSRSDRLEWDGRAPSTLHAVIVTLGTAWLFLVSPAFRDDGPEGGLPFVLRASPLSTAVLGFATGYFLVDLAMLVAYYPSFGGPEIAAHHVAALASVAISALQRQGQAYTLALLATECTTPLVNARWLMDKGGLRESGLYALNGFAMLVSWFFARVLMFAFFFAHLWWHRGELGLLSSSVLSLVAIVPPSLFALNFFWFWKIFQGALKLVVRGKPAEAGTAREQVAASKQD